MGLTKFQSSVLRTLASYVDPVTRVEVPVGSGKTLLSLLAPMVIRDCRVAARFVEPAMIGHYERAYRAALGEGARLPSILVGEYESVVPGEPVLHVLSHVSLSRMDGSRLLSELWPDVIVVDERAFPGNSARVYRLDYYLNEQNRGARLVVRT